MRHFWRKYIGLAVLAIAFAGPAVSAQEQSQQESNTSSKAVQQQLHDLLSSWYPPSLREVLQLDPTLLRNPEYLKIYPKLSDFLNAHPEIAHNPAYFLGTRSEYGYRLDYAPRQRTVADAMEPIAAVIAFLGALGMLIWVIRAFVDHRRWLRVSKLQTEAHTKILERFGSNEDLLNFIQTPAGKRFLESSAIPVEPRNIGAPVARILWSVQAGFVLLCLGIGMALMSYVPDEPEVARVLFVFGGLVIAMGIGFVGSGIASYTLSRRFGLFDQTSAATFGSGAPGPS